MISAVLPADGSIHPGNASQFANHTQSARAEASGISKRQQQKLDALAKAGRGDLLAQIRAGNISVRQAMVELGAGRMRRGRRAAEAVKPVTTVTGF